MWLPEDFAFLLFIKTLIKYYKQVLYVTFTLSSQILKLIFLVYCLLSPFLFHLWYWHSSSLHLLHSFSISCLAFKSEISLIVKFCQARVQAMARSNSTQLSTLLFVSVFVLYTCSCYSKFYFIWKNITLILVCDVVISGTAASVLLPWSKHDEIPHWHRY